MKLHHTMRVYNSGNRTHNGVLPEDLKLHTDYNLTMRPGCAFFVDGVCLAMGALSLGRVADIEDELKTNPVAMDRATLPYS